MCSSPWEHTGRLQPRTGKRDDSSCGEEHGRCTKSLLQAEENASAEGLTIGKTGLITEMKKFATHDGPGIRTTVFLKGCPLRCRWCSNPETISPFVQLYFLGARCRDYGGCVDVCPAGAIRRDRENRIDRGSCTLCMKCVQECPHGAFRPVGFTAAVGDVLKDIEKDIPFYGGDGGLTLSGGEPLFQPDFTVSLLRECREKNITTVVDTSGYASANVVEAVMKYTDLVLLDIKHMDPALHRRGTGVDNGLILSNARLMSRMTRVRISLPLIPGFNDNGVNLSETAKFAISLGISDIDINPLHVLGTDKYRFLGVASPYEDFRGVEIRDLAGARKIFEDAGLHVTIGRMM